MRPQQDAQSARDLQARPAGAEVSLSVAERDRTRELQPERDNFRFAPADRRRLPPYLARVIRAGYAIRY